MTPPERHPSTDPREWLNRARSNLAQAGSRLPGVYLEDLCFDAQQAAEKAIKGVLISRNIEFPYVHDLARLLLILESHGERIPADLRRAGRLTPYAVATRYPGPGVPVSEAQYLEALEIAETIVDWAEESLGGTGADR
ncbi:MAG: HEPN domain-containing protein [Gemmatimonadetes bacterium]|nr:HEPN domain-containing protein [Gemmatimonadota bacterium]MCZ0936041.1 HEPN domain-containing protein [Candidatus Palauibacter rhopaloidicola]